MRRNLFTEDHESFRQLARDFIEKEVAPHYPDWEKAGRMPREVFEQMGTLGMLGMAIPEEYGGSRDRRLPLQRRAAGGGRPGPGHPVDRPHPARRDPPVFPALRERRAAGTLVPGLAAGTLLTAVAMTEPGTGSDLAGVRSTAVRDGDDYVLNGAKTFITGGIQADLVIGWPGRPPTPTTGDAG